MNASAGLVPASRPVAKIKGGRGLCAAKSVEFGEHRSSIPISWPYEPGNLLALFVQNQGCGKPRRFKPHARLSGHIMIKLQLDYALASQDCGGRLRSASVHAQSYNRDVAANLGLKPVQRRHFHLARRAPRRPEIEKDQLAPPLRQSPEPSFRVCKGDLRHHPRLSVANEFTSQRLGGRLISGIASTHGKEESGRHTEDSGESGKGHVLPGLAKA